MRPRPGVERLALGRQVQAPRGPLQQARTEPVLEAGHQLGQGGGRQAHIPRRSREPAGFHGANEMQSSLQTRSMGLLWNNFHQCCSITDYCIYFDM
jgi:hypothetical protein